MSVKLALAWYLAGLFTVPVGALIWGTAHWAFSKTEGTGECLVEGCKSKPKELGEHFNITVWANSMQHRLFQSSRHRRAVMAYWQGQKDKGLGVHPKAIKKLK